MLELRQWLTCHRRGTAVSDRCFSCMASSLHRGSSARCQLDSVGWDIAFHGVDLGGLFGRLNARPIEEVAHVVADRIEQLAHDLRGERIDLVGHSEGGPSAGGSAAPAAPLLVQTSEGAVNQAWRTWWRSSALRHPTYVHLGRAQRGRKIAPSKG